MLHCCRSSVHLSACSMCTCFTVPLQQYYVTLNTFLVNNNNKKAQLMQGLCATAPSFQDGRRQHHHSKMAASYHLAFYRTANNTIRSADPENHNLEPNMEWIGCNVCEIFAFKLYCDLVIWVQGYSRSSKVALFDRAHTTLYSSSIVTMPLSITVSEI